MFNQHNYQTMMDTEKVLKWFDRINEANPDTSKEFYRVGQLLSMLHSLRDDDLDSGAYSIDHFKEKGQIASLHCYAMSLYVNMKYLACETHIIALIRERLESMLEDELNGLYKQYNQMRNDYEADLKAPL